MFQLLLSGWWLSKRAHVKMEMLMTKATPGDLLTLRDLAEAGAIAPAIGRRYPLSQVADAIRDLEQRRASGKIVITVQAE